MPVWIREKIYDNGDVVYDSKNITVSFIGIDESGVIFKVYNKSSEVRDFYFDEKCKYNGKKLEDEGGDWIYVLPKTTAEYCLSGESIGEHYNASKFEILNISGFSDGEIEVEHFKFDIKK